MQKKTKQTKTFLIIAESFLLVLVFILLFSLIMPNEILTPFIRTFFCGSIIFFLIIMFLLYIIWSNWILKRMDQVIANMEEESKASEVMTREMISSITHDLKTPLASVKGYAQGILDGIASSPDKLNKYVTTIHRKANDMTSLIDELSFFSNIYKKDVPYHWEIVDANTYFSNCVSDLSLDLETKKISLLYNFQGAGKVKIRIDEEKLKRVINNVIGNSSKYIQSKMGIVFVNIEQTDDELIVHIQDNGIGIDKEDLERIFERFYRTDRSRNSDTGGTGLGLAIAKKIIEDHNGKIWADSVVGEGTTISFSLPKFFEQM